MSISFLLSEFRSPPYAHPLRALSFFSLCSLRHALIQQRAKVFVCKKKVRNVRKKCSPLRLPAFGEFILSKKQKLYKLMSVLHSILKRRVYRVPSHCMLFERLRLIVRNFNLKPF
jgi:hypothetical protein